MIPEESPQGVAVARALLERQPDLVLSAEALSAFRLQPMVVVLGHAAVAQATGLTFDEVLRRCCVELASREGAERLLERLANEMPPIIDSIPGVTRLGSALPPLSKVMRDARDIAAHRGYELPSAEHSSWVSWLRKSELHPCVAHHIARTHRVRLESGEVLEPLFPIEQDTIYGAYGLTRQTWMSAQLEYANEVMNGLRKAPSHDEIDRLVGGVSGVIAFERTEPDSNWSFRRFIPGKGETTIAPPWQRFPEPPGSMRWRMGPGEEFMETWMVFWRGLTSSEREAYVRERPPPEDWRTWLTQLELVTT